MAALLAYGTGIGIGWWGNNQVAAANNAVGGAGAEKALEQLGATMGTLFTAYKISLVVLMLAGLAFLISLVFWLLAMQRRRKLANPNSLV
ncbi:hypothetical protein KBB96_16620 [Luteolibacter ambystomatis]|uniref:Uncharacterized protein n=1 Tax=Luteolibacter ambystomatis TaxID=2824561 RepID=A0A975IYK1_9BACT|nr:hypothetical protein [Luteolibacter ambystomatis]QUE50476.1 hypothetical protein KBB96_16620 [Luteolibacter ambystomatis]